ncbi:MAG TPA: GNAT family protein [Candidatus Methylomirabilis sp.]|nr:GNAT family protein [Candidatus Methylomirabilis sp.]
MARASRSSRRAPLQIGKRVYLRRPTAHDEDEYLALRRRSAAFLRRWEPAAPRGRTPHQLYVDWLESARGGRHEKLLICRKGDGAILGAINLNEIIRGPAQSAFLGYWIGAAHARQGYMTEALALALRHAFGPLRLHRVEANIRPVNVPSLALVRRAGFHCEGYSPGYLQIDGRWEDHERWALVADRRGRGREKIGARVTRSQPRAIRSQS